jgi:CHAT domain-containing protein/tetratricopeptide (TPR) repeat protein
MSKRAISFIVSRAAAPLGLIGAMTLGGLALVANAAPRAESFLLGQGATGAVCDARRDDGDAVLRIQRKPDRSLLPWARTADDGGAAEVRGAKAWRVNCRGLTVTVGRLYVFGGGGQATLAGGRWSKSLEGRAQCGQAEPATVSGFASVTRRACKLEGGDYVAYVARGAGGAVYVAEGYAGYADLLQQGLGILSGARPPPQVIEGETVAMGGSSAGAGAALPADERAWDEVRFAGYDNLQQWRFTDAENTFRALMIRSETNGASASQKADVVLNLALAVSNDGRFSEADALFERAVPLVREAGDKELSALEANYRALHLRNQGRFRDAIGQAELAIRSRPVEGDAVELTDLSGNSLQIGSGAAARLNRAESLSALDPASRLKPTQRWKIQDAQAWHVIATSQRALGQRAEARDALGKARQALTDSRDKSASVWLDARIAISEAEFKVEDKRPAEASASLEAALKRLKTVQAGTAAEASLLVELGRARYLSGKPDEARKDFAAAFKIFSDVRGEVGPSLDRTGPYFQQLIAAQAAGDQTATAELFRALQSGVGPSTARTMTNLSAQLAQGDGLTASLARGLNDTRRLADGARVELARLQGRKDVTPQQIEAVNARLAGYEAQADQIEGQLVARNPGYGQLLEPLIELPALQASLRPGEIYLKSLLLPEAGYAMAVTRDTVKAYRIEARRDAILADAARLRTFDKLGADGVTRQLTPFDLARSLAMFETLMGPAKGEVLAASHIIYDPDGALLNLPPTLLVVDQASVERVAKAARPGRIPNYAGVNWLGRNRGVSTSVSGASFVQVRKAPVSTAANAFVGFADPALSPDVAVQRSGPCARTVAQIQSFGALPETREEVATVANALKAPADSLVMGADFTDRAVKARGESGALKGYRVVYFATHSVFRQGDECLPQPGLVTSYGGDGSDLLLDTQEIIALNLNADLVVLAACDTGGAGGEGAGGEALGGLTRAFVAAGARTLIVTHWPIDSKATAQLMSNLFGSDQAAQARALSSAMGTLMDQPRRSHPYFWSGFAVVGDGARAMPSARAS